MSVNARWVLLFGAAGSLGLTLYFGRHNPHMSITVLFAGWVTAPFVILEVLDRVMARRALVLRTSRVLGWIIGVGSMVTYTLAIQFPRTVTPAAPFVAAPIVAFVLIAIAIPVAALRARRPPAP